MKEDHNCNNLTPLGARPIGSLQQQKERGLAALEKLRIWGASKKAAAGSSSAATESKSKSSGGSFLSKVTSRSSTTSSKTSSVAALNKLKQTAKGDEKIPQANRIYLHVEASADTTKAKHPTGDFFYNKEWSVGRVLDIAAKALQVQNVNNRGNSEEDKLRVFHVEGGKLLEFSEKLGQNCQSGNTIVLLRGVGPAVPDLIQA
jgi:AN1-type zinc finger protein 1